jgi:hypothetical protein
MALAEKNAGVQVTFIAVDEMNVSIEVMLS